MAIVRAPIGPITSPGGARAGQPGQGRVIPAQVRRPSFAGAAAPREPTLPAGSHANLQLYNQAIPPSGTMVLDSGNFFFLLSTGVTLNVLFIYATGATEIMNGLQAGSQIKRVRPWTRCQITGTGGAVINFWHGYEFSREDQTNFLSTIATISGAVQTVPAAMSGGITDHADVTVAATTIDTTIAANALRKFVLIGSFSSNAPTTPLNLRVGGSGLAVTEGVELQAGQFISYQETSAIHVNNPDASAQKYWWQELS